jgi:hypothetical protein
MVVIVSRVASHNTWISQLSILVQSNLQLTPIATARSKGTWSAAVNTVGSRIAHRRSDVD